MNNIPTPPADAQVRRDVLSVADSWMLQAPAGSGKTELLMQRFLACLAEVEQPESVLAITFTRKAAAEMRNRILLALQKAARMTDEEIVQCKPHEKTTLGLARQVLRASDERGWKILDHPSRLQVRTLDAFCEAVAQRAPFRGMLGGAAQISEDATPLYTLAAQRVLQELAEEGAAGDAIESLLVHLDNDVRAARTLLASMLAQRDQWLNYIGRADQFDEKQWSEFRHRLESALRTSIEEDLAMVRQVVERVLDKATRAEMLELMRYAAMHRDPETPEAVSAIAASAEVVAISSQPRPWPATTQLEPWREVCRFLLTADTLHPGFRRKVDKRNGFPSTTQQQKAERDRCVASLQGIAALDGAEELCAALNRVRRLPDPYYTESQWRFMRAVLHVLPRAAAHLAVVFAEQGTVDFAEYAFRALDAIGGEGDPTELGLQLGYRIRHVLVDEFQDTNRVQMDLLYRLLKTWEEDECCSTFCVGDPMQSIYAFRQADVSIFQQTRAAGIGGRGHYFRQLTENFRSQEKLVEWFNQTFPGILSEDSDLTNAVRYAAATTSRPALAEEAVRMKGFAAGESAAEARYVAQCVRQELDVSTPEGEKPASIAILVRSRSHLPELVAALREAGIDYRAVKTDRLADRSLVRDLEALRSALTDLADRTAWLAVLRAPWCGLALQDLLTLCRGNEEATMLELLRQRSASLGEAARMALARVLPVLEEAVEQRGRGTLRALVESTWLRLGGPACASAMQQPTADAETYFALLDAESEAGVLVDPASFVRKLRDLFAPPDADGAIRVAIMPIHQAKGLEWDVVFLPALGKKPRQEDKHLLYWRLRRGAGGESLLLGPMEAAGTDDGKATIERYLRWLEGECSREELKRLFYVACTRARRRLYLSTTVPAVNHAPDANSMLRLLWDASGMQAAFAPEAVEDTGDVAEEVKVEKKLELLLRRLPAAFVMPARPVPLAWSVPRTEGGEHRFEWVGDLLPRVGVVAHGFLQRIAQQGPGQWDRQRVEAARPRIAAALERAGVLRGDLQRGVDRVVEALTKTLDDERGRWLLSAHAEHQCEFALSAVVAGGLEHIRVDRTFVENGVRWLIDYKITEQQGGDAARFVRMQAEKYTPDMERYVRVLRAFDPRPVRCALYLPLMGVFCPVEIGQAQASAGRS